MVELRYEGIKRTTWKVEVLARLVQVEEDISQAISAAGWTLKRDEAVPRIDPDAKDDPATIQQKSEAQAAVNATYEYISKTKETLQPLEKPRQRFRDLLTGEMLMSAFTNLHAAEANRVLLLSSCQLAAILPSIRQRAIAYLAPSDSNRDALNSIPDPTAPVHQATVARVQARTGQLAPQATGRGHGTASAPTARPGPNAQPEPKEGADPNAGNPAAAEHDAGTGGRPVADQSQQSPPGDGPGSAQASGINMLTGLLGTDQQIAFRVMNAACQAEDQQQLQVRHFRGVLLGTSAALGVVVAVLWIVGSLRPTYFPVCWPVPGSHPAKMICPSGGGTPSIGGMPLVMGLGAIGAALAVATNLAGLKPSGVRFSLTVAQGLLKIALGAITAVLGIILLRTETNAPGFLASQPGLLASAVVFGYSQQVFTRLVDHHADNLVDAASPKTPATDSGK